MMKLDRTSNAFECEERFISLWGEGGVGDQINKKDVENQANEKNKTLVTPGKRELRREGNNFCWDEEGLGMWV